MLRYASALERGPGLMGPLRMTTSEQSTPSKPDTKTLARYTFAVRAREVELELFWKRALFFWGFIGAAFVAYASARSSVRLSAVVAAFGLVCSVVWSLANRGSKYWYENWETKVEKSELTVTGRWLATQEKQKADNWWLRSRRFSVSKLAIALSDYIALVWLMLLGSRITVILELDSLFPAYRDTIAVAFSVASVAYALALFWFARSKHS
jgi:hypothetical protein